MSVIAVREGKYNAEGCRDFSYGPALSFDETIIKLYEQVKKTENEQIRKRLWAILPALGVPDWHGDNVNAIVESMVWGEINSLEPPSRVEVAGRQ